MTNRLVIAKRAVEAATLMLELKRRTLRKETKRAVSKQLFYRQLEEVENKLVAGLSKFFSAQIKTVVDSVAKSNEIPKGTKGIFGPKDWDLRLVNTTLPVLAKGMGEAAVAQLLMLGVDPRKGMKSVVKSTATDWLLEEGEELAPGLATDLPRWMQDAIEVMLRDTFAEPYWQKINETTRDDIERILRTGLQEGWSTQDLARGISDAFPADYSVRRATLVARTEAGNALNAARDLSIKFLKEELPPEVSRYISKSWLSVLGNTTRDTHADADSQMADGNGLFEVGGYKVPWPSHPSLPPGERCNCQCTILTELGVGGPSIDEMQSLLNSKAVGRSGFKTNPYHDPKTGRFTTGAGEVLDAAIRSSEGVWSIQSSGEQAPEHIQKLGIPPAWSDVFVNQDKEGDLLVRAKDSKGRVQARYSDNHNMRAAADKFGRVQELREKRQKIVEEVEADAKNPALKENAECLLTVMKIGIRPGSEEGESAGKKTYGATTLEGRHVVAEGKEVRLKFIGKSGKDLDLPVLDKDVKGILVTRSKNAGASGRLFSTDAVSLRDYSKSKDGGGFKTKDHRTALGTETAIKLIAGRGVPKTKAEYKNAVKEVARQVSVVLGNTPSIALKAYIDPTVFAGWRVE